MSCIPAGTAAGAVGSSSTGAPKTMLCYIPAASSSSPDRSGSYSNHELELLQDAHNSTAELERFYVSSNPLLGSNGGSLLQSMHTEEQQQQDHQKVEGERKRSNVNGEFKLVSSLRSPIAGDLPSPQQMGSMQPLTVKLLHGFNHPHTPTQSSSAAVEDASLSPSTPHSTFPGQCANILDSTSLLPHSLGLTELVSPISLSPSNGNDHADSPHQPLMCLWDKCQLEFCSLSSLVTHLDRTHTLAMSQFVCLWENCSRELKPFDARYKLITHLRCHTGEKPYQCDVASCKRSFSRLENLKLHTRTHTGEKPYQCDFPGCLKKFNNTSDRAKHKKTHITRKPYACKYLGCGKSYTDPSSMRKHIKYAHRQKEAESGGGAPGRDLFPLSTLPKRKRNSASSSSSSSSSSTSHASSAVLPHVTVLGGQEPAGSPPVYGIAGSPGSSQPQLIPMVKIGGKGQGTQPVLVPAYQQPPMMMIVANASKPANWVTVPSSSTQHHPLPASNGTVLSSTLAGNATHAIGSDVRGEVPNSQAKYQTPPANVEDQLRLQIVHLQQQLYQSQLAAARATQRQIEIVTVSQGNDHTHSTQHVVGKGTLSPLHTVTMAERFLPSTNGTDQSSLGMVTGVKSVSMTTPHPRVADVPMGRPILVSNTTAAADMGTLPNASVLPQYIPIVHPQEVAGAQYLYMSP